MSSLLAAAMLVAFQSADSTLLRLEGLGLPVLRGAVPTYYSPDARARATSLQAATRTTVRLIRDSLRASPPDVRIAVLDEDSWPDVVPWQLPYGIHTLAGPPHVFLVPSKTDRGQYFDSLSTEPQLRVDAIGLHYLAHHLALAVYPTGAESEPPVKWLDELITLIVEDRLHRAFDPRLAELELFEPVEARDFRVTTLRGFEEEYDGYFASREGASNYRWFIERLDEVGHHIMSRRGWGLLRELRPHLEPGLDSGDAIRLLEDVGVDLSAFGLAGGQVEWDGC